MIAHFVEHSANERTFLAWVRTALGFVGLGLGIARFGLVHPPLWVEVGLILSGLLTILFAFVRMQRFKTRIERADLVEGKIEEDDWLLVLLMIALLAMLSMFVLYLS